MSEPDPKRGEVWFVDLKPSKGHEQGGPPRPCLVVQADALQARFAGMSIIIPGTTTDRGIATHVRAQAGDGGLDRDTVFMVEQIRAVSTKRFRSCRGSISRNVMGQVEEMLAHVLDLDLG